MSSLILFVLFLKRAVIWPIIFLGGSEKLLSFTIDVLVLFCFLFLKSLGAGVKLIFIYFYFLGEFLFEFTWVAIYFYSYSLVNMTAAFGLPEGETGIE